MRKSLNRHTELRSLLEHLNLGGMAAVFADLALKAAKENLSHEAYLLELATHEEEQRIQRRTTRLLRQSGLPLEKTFRTDRGWNGSPPPCSCRSSASRVVLFWTTLSM
jgi:DNA replication protein DnaC